MKEALALAVVFVVLSASAYQRKNAQREDQSASFQPSASQTSIERLNKAGIPENCLDGLKPTTQLPESFTVSSREAFRCEGLYSDKPWLKDALMKSMESEPYWALVFYYQYAHQPWAPEVFSRAVKLDPGWTFYFFSARTGFNGNHSPSWYDERVPGLMALLRSEIETSVDKGHGVRALEFLVKERDFPDREAFLQRLIPELLIWEELRSLELANIAEQLHQIKEPYAVEALGKLKANINQRYQYFRRVLAGS